jgi:orotidine-5'-phosphate decarboxylase
VRERLIVALDVPDPGEARRLVAGLGDAVHFYKLGLELLMAGGYFELVRELRAGGKRIFADLKFFDVPETVAAAVRQLRGKGADFVTVHGNDAILEAACREKAETKVLAVTALTSLDKGDLQDLGFHCDVRELELTHARGALPRCDGGISSASRRGPRRSRRALRSWSGIRPAENRREDDQKRVMTPEQAFLAAPTTWWGTPHPPGRPARRGLALGDDRAVRVQDSPSRGLSTLRHLLFPALPPRPQAGTTGDTRAHRPPVRSSGMTQIRRRGERVGVTVLEAARTWCAKKTPREGGPLRSARLRRAAARP